MDNTENKVADTENVARILRPNWVVDGILQHYAFDLRRNETYISVNRPAVSSYADDVKSFVESHPDFYSDSEKTEYARALLYVGNIRNSEISFDGIKLNIDVEVEPRDGFAKSHAGIFTRSEGKNIKTGETIKIEPMEEEVSSDDILLEVRSRLLDISKIEYCPMEPND